MLIYSHTVTPRLQYVASFLTQYYGESFLLTTDWQYFQSADKHKINYSATSINEQTLWIKPVDLLFEAGVKKQSIDCFEHAHGYKAFFATEGALGFDLFAAVFYLLSRYEEYLPHQKDSYGRYAHENSLAYKNGFLHLPLINIWLEDFREILQEIWNLELGIRSFQFVPTYDIDIAWSYQNKGFLRNAGGTVKSIVNGQWARVRERFKVLRGKEQDPYDCYDWLDAIHWKYELWPLYFFHVGQERNQYDKNIATTNSAFQELIKHHAHTYVVGLHPSWSSGDKAEFFQKEKEELERLASQKITFSRQHYIRFTLPDTFRRLIHNGIREDYSMGYGSINGFRASISTPFHWYDLDNEVATILQLHPFCFMDANAFFEQNLSVEDAFDELMHYYHVTKQCGAVLITIWHNQFLGTDPMFKGWQELYERFLKTVVY
ncbi:polysaccharide deacetylase family protein [Flavisolibacter tropicus]|uniref:DUF7033 domain-containing protein n=1 Tax=Flavisolibacter tropicus TaxID=1492898 RepID=A0A172TYK5_9BACT|nr:polysaccharide deacetylase family protein [Flavisolibacter tropicus]ANE52048.1 hypothetical protein SY85_17645 [Flavisolibacter tropicus]